jgi:hypothetical protein
VSQIHLAGHKLANVTSCGLNCEPADKVHITGNPLVATCIQCLEVERGNTTDDSRHALTNRIVRLRTARANA